MKVFSVLGSPNKNGNTATLLTEFLRGVQENHSHVEYSNVMIKVLQFNVQNYYNYYNVK